MPAIELHQISRTFGAVHAVENLDLTVEEGEFFGLVGPNGSGKTTTLRMLSTLLPPSGGQGKIFGFDLKSQGHRIRPLLAAVFHDSTLDIDATVLANLHLYLDLIGQPRDRADEAMAAMQLEDVRQKKIRTLSWGMKRRVELARVLAGRPRLILLDEPTLGLDRTVRPQVFAALERYRRQNGATILACTHDPDLIECCSRIATLAAGRLQDLAIPAPDSPPDSVVITPAPGARDAVMAVLRQMDLEATETDGRLHLEARRAADWLGELLTRCGPAIQAVSYSAGPRLA